MKSEYNGNLYDDLSYGSMKTDGTKKQIILPVSPFYNFEINKEYVYYTERHTDLFYRMKKMVPQLNHYPQKVCQYTNFMVMCCFFLR